MNVLVDISKSIKIVIVLVIVAAIGFAVYYFGDILSSVFGVLDTVVDDGVEETENFFDTVYEEAEYTASEIEDVADSVISISSGVVDIVEDVGEDLISGDIEDISSDVVDDVEDTGKETVDDIENIGKDVADGTEDAAKSVGNAFCDIFDC